MFTGIVKELGIARFIGKAGGIYRLEIGAKGLSRSVKIGDSVSVNGVCLTVVGNRNDLLSFDVMEETVRRTNLAQLKTGAPVNLEDSLRTGDSLGGHFVLGHIDCLGTISEIEKTARNFAMTIDCPPDFAHFLVEKGSVAIDGVSLTIGEARKGRFKVYLIPHTLGLTILGSRKTGDRVNIEFDIIGKYVLKAMPPAKGSRITESFLKEKGF